MFKVNSSSIKIFSFEKPLLLKKKYLFYLILYFLLLIFPLTLKPSFPYVPSYQFPPYYVLVLWGLPILTLCFIKNVLSQFLSIIWILWYIVGSINVIAAADYYGSYYYLDVSKASLIYVSFTLLFIIGILVFENYFFLRSSRSSTIMIKGNEIFKEINPLFTLLIVSFPFLWIISIYLSLGYIPLISALRGLDLTSQIYELSYGPIYGFSLVNVLAMLVVLDKLRTKTKLRLFFMFLIFIFGVFTVITGKRFSIVVFSVATLIYLLRTIRFSLTKLILSLTFIVFIYISILIVRQGLDATRYSSLAGKLIITGVEYRAFTYAVNHTAPGDIRGYDWALSTIGSTVNSRILQIFGYNKNDLVQMGSAYSWRNLFESPYGIRSGIISEIYMAYGYIGGILLFIFGIITAWVSIKIASTHKKINLIFLSTIYGLLIISIVGQTTDTAGGIVIVFYTWIGYYITELFYALLRISAPVYRNNLSIKS